MKQIKLNDGFFSVLIYVVALPAMLWVLPLYSFSITIGLLLGFWFTKIGKLSLFPTLIWRTLLVGIGSYLAGLCLLLLVHQIMPLSITKEVEGIGIIDSVWGILAALLSAVCGYFLHRFYSFHKLEAKDKEKSLLALIVAIVSSPYLFLIPSALMEESNPYTSLEQHANTYVGDNSAVSAILSKLPGNAYRDYFELKTAEEPYGIVVHYKPGTIFNGYKIMEKDALVLFRLIRNVDYVSYEHDEKTYRFDKVYFEKIYGEEFGTHSIATLMKRYEGTYLGNEEIVYLGNINGKYDVMDESTWCSAELEVIHEDDQNQYLISCSQTDYIYLVDENDQTFKIKEALNKELVTPDEVLGTNVKLYKEKK